MSTISATPNKPPRKGRITSEDTKITNSLSNDAERRSAHLRKSIIIQDKNTTNGKSGKSVKSTENAAFFVRNRSFRKSASKGVVRTASVTTKLTKIENTASKDMMKTVSQSLPAHRVSDKFSVDSRSVGTNLKNRPLPDASNLISEPKTPPSVPNRPSPAEIMNAGPRPCIAVGKLIRNAIKDISAIEVSCIQPTPLSVSAYPILIQPLPKAGVCPHLTVLTDSKPISYSTSTDMYATNNAKNVSLVVNQPKTSPAVPARPITLIAPSPAPHAGTCPPIMIGMSSGAFLDTKPIRPKSTMASVSSVPSHSLKPPPPKPTRPSPSRPIRTPSGKVRRSELHSNSFRGKNSGKLPVPHSPSTKILQEKVSTEAVYSTVTSLSAYDTGLCERLNRLVADGYDFDVHSLVAPKKMAPKR